MDIFSKIKGIHITQKISNLESIKNDSINNVQREEKESNVQKEIEKKINEDMKKELKKVVEEINKEINPLNIGLEFKFNDKIEELTVQVVDKTNNKVIREFPPEEAVKLMEKMKELVGMLFDKKG